MENNKIQIDQEKLKASMKGLYEQGIEGAEDQSNNLQIRSYYVGIHTGIAALALDLGLKEIKKWECEN